MESSNSPGAVKGNEVIDKKFLLAGIGASAGGIQALKNFFTNVPADSGIAYVVILHLSPEFDSQLAQIIQTVSKIPVEKIIEKTRVLPNRVYVISPRNSLKMIDGHIGVEPVHSIEERRAPIDIFFRTLADSHKANAVAIILSGTGADGTMGLKRVKENGGTVFVQNPDDAEYSDMPRNAIATNLIDEILNAEEIPGRIMAFKERVGIIEIPVTPETMDEEEQAALREIFTQLRVRTGHDFSNYKRATVLRRIERRINVRGIASLSEYAAFVRDIPEETHALLKDLLISVTNFFRDKDYFTELEKTIIPKILQDKKAHDHIRIWVAGCATGEEAYSIAMLFAEQLTDVADAPTVQIFATDIDDNAIARARDGFYTLNDAADVVPDRLRRFFLPENNGFRITRQLRETILFANHDVLKDPPFSRLDMVTCRNLLIYFNQIAQNRVMETFHFALNPGGFLFLGSSESIDGSNDLYASVSKAHQIFQSRQATVRFLPLPDVSIPSVRTRKSDTENGISRDNVTRESKPLERISLGDLHQRLLEQYAPPSVIVNENHEIVHLSENAGRFMQIPGGDPSSDILRLVKQELRLELRTALYSAMQKGINVEVKNLAVNTGTGSETINLLVRPVLRPDDTARGFILIIFEPSQEKEQRDSVEILAANSESLTLQMEQEIINLKNHLRSSNQQYEVQTEELKASNEELQAMNEELRSAAEELETSKEELQSVNEELITVNQELKIKIEEVSQSNNDFKNLINSIDIGTIFLDRNFRVKMFTPAIRDVFNLIQADIGRPLSDITNRLAYSELLADAETVLTKLQSVEREVVVKGGHAYLMQIQPYRTAEDRISGVVIVFINISQLKKAEQALRTSEERLRLAIEAGNIGTCDWNYQTGEMRWNDIRFRLYGLEPQHQTMHINDFYASVHPDDRKQVQEIITTGVEKHGKHSEEYRVVLPNGAIHRIAETGSVVEWQDDKPLRIISVLFDVTEQHKRQDILRESEEHYRAIFNQATAGVSEMDTNGNISLASQTFCDMLGYTPQELLTLNIRDITHEESLESCLSHFKNTVETGESYTTEKKMLCKDGTAVWVNDSISAVRDEEGKTKSIIAVAIDIDKRKNAEDALQKSEEHYRIALEAGELATWDWNLLTNKITWNTQHFRLFGVDHDEEYIEPEYFLKFIYPEDLQTVKYQLSEVIGETGIYEADFRITRQNNKQLRWMSGYGRVTERVNGNPTRVSGVMFDSTEQRQAEEQRETAVNNLNTALEAANMGVWNMDLETRLVDRSARHDQLLGYNAWQEQWSEEKTKQHIIEEDKKRFDEEYQKIFTKGTFQLEARVKHFDGSICWINYYGRTFKNEKGEPARAAGVIFDITDRKTIEKQKDEFIGIASHELKTPVTSIKAYAEILQELFTEANDAKSAELMGKLDGQVDRLTVLIRDLLDVTKVSEGQLHLTTEAFSIEILIKDILEEMQRTTRQHAIRLTMTTLPEIIGDKERISQVLTNLLSNAIKYSPNTDDILVNARYEEGKVFISVQDTGIGMSPGTMARLFERFYRSDNPNVRSYPGLGLGLFISMEIMKRHGGTILVKSEKEKGSLFTMVFPYTNHQEQLTISS